MRTLLAILLLGITTTVYGQVECEEDRFKGTTACKTEVISLSTSGTDIFRANIMAVKSDNEYAIAFAFASDSWKFLRQNEVYFLLDGQAETFKLHRSDTNVKSGTVIEQYAIILSEQQASDFANAQTIEFKISNSEFVYPKEAHRQLVELVNHN